MGTTEIDTDSGTMRAQPLTRPSATMSVLIGVLLGWADHIRRTGGRPHWRWLALAPLMLGLLPLTVPGTIAFRRVVAVRDDAITAAGVS